MKHSTRAIKRTSNAFKSLTFEGSSLGTLASLLDQSKRGFDEIVAQIKRIIVHFLLFSERESLAGQDYSPNQGWKNGGVKRARFTSGVRK